MGAATWNDDRRGCDDDDKIVLHIDHFGGRDIKTVAKGLMMTVVKAENRKWWCYLVERSLGVGFAGSIQISHLQLFDGRGNKKIVGATPSNVGWAIQSPVVRETTDTVNYVPSETCDIISCSRCISLVASFLRQCWLGAFHWRLSDNKFPLITRTLLSIFGELKKTKFWRVSILLLIFNSSWLFFQDFGNRSKQIHQNWHHHYPLSFTVFFVLLKGLSICLSFCFLLFPLERQNSPGGNFYFSVDYH